MTKAACAAAKRDREQDILDQLACGQIDKDQAGKLLTDLYEDFYEAMSALRMADECNETKTPTVKDKANAP